MKKKNPASLPIPVPSPKLSSFQRLKVESHEDNGHVNTSFTEEPTYYNTKDELITASSGVPVAQFNNYIKEREKTKNGFKDEFSVSVYLGLILY